MISLKSGIFKGYLKLRYVCYSKCGSNFFQTILICSIDIQQADSMKKLSKMINYCHFSGAENTIS